VISGDSAILIDPTFDTMIYQETLTKTKATLKHILLTHFHADYVAGHLEFKVPLIMGEKASRPGLGFKVEEQKNGSTITLGEVKLTVIHTPGHTLESSCYMLTDREGKDDILFTGDTLFLGEIGRPDLAVSSEMKSEDLAGLLFDSLQKIKALNPHLKILPGHGSGSSCGKSIGDGNVCTLEKQLKNNYALNITSKAEFVKKVLEDMPKAPQYFFHDAKLNQTGPPSFQTQFKQNSTLLTVDQFKDALKKGSVVVDTRANMEQLKKGISVMLFRLH
jgi:hydroxyacylglutathione hydrolase